MVQNHLAGCGCAGCTQGGYSQSAFPQSGAQVSGLSDNDLNLTSVVIRSAVGGGTAYLLQTKMDIHPVFASVIGAVMSVIVGDFID